jgi:hypothetical protein
MSLADVGRATCSARQISGPHRDAGYTGSGPGRCGSLVKKLSQLNFGWILGSKYRPEDRPDEVAQTGRDPLLLRVLPVCWVPVFASPSEGTSRSNFTAPQNPPCLTNSIGRAFSKPPLPYIYFMMTFHP